MRDTPTKIQDRAGNWVARGLIAAGRGIALAGLTLAAVGLWVVLLTAVALAPLGIGLPAIPGTLRAMRRLENTVRRRTGDWCGVAIGVPYLPEQPLGKSAGRVGCRCRDGGRPSCGAAQRPAGHAAVPCRRYGR